MSHFTNIDTKITDLVCLKAALEDLGLAFDEATENQLVYVKGWRGAQQQAELSIHMTSHYDVGVRQNADGTFGLVGDWWAIEEETEEKQEVLQQRLLQRYAFHKAKSEAKKQGFTIDSEDVAQDGTIRLSVSRDAPAEVQVDTSVKLGVTR